MKELIKITEENGRKLVSARELYVGLGYNISKGNFTHWIKVQLESVYAIENTDFTKISFKNKGNNTNITDYITTIDIAKEICRKQRRNKCAMIILNYLLSLDGKEVYYIERPRKEVEFGEALVSVLKPFDLKIKKQHTIFNYRLDFYIPELNVAIEFDENNHKYYSHEQQEGRQAEIQQELGCKFIRVSDENDIFSNIGYVIKEILDSLKFRSQVFNEKGAC